MFLFLDIYLLAISLIDGRLLASRLLIFPPIFITIIFFIKYTKGNIEFFNFIFCRV